MTRKVSINRRLFCEDPRKRFARVFNCHFDVWADAWRRYKYLDYSIEESREYLIFILKKPISRIRMKRWIDRTEAYNKAQVALKKGVKEVQEDYFGKLAPMIIREINKNN